MPTSSITVNGRRVKPPPKDTFIVYSPNEVAIDSPCCELILDPKKDNQVISLNVKHKHKQVLMNNKDAGVNWEQESPKAKHQRGELTFRYGGSITCKYSVLDIHTGSSSSVAKDSGLLQGISNAATTTFDNITFNAGYTYFENDEHGARSRYREPCTCDNVLFLLVPLVVLFFIAYLLFSSSMTTLPPYNQWW